MSVLVILLILALLFGVGAVVKGLLWLGLIAVVLVIVAVVTGRNALSKR